MLVFGTRPEAIKMAPLVKEFQSDPQRFRTVVCVTGQHRQMLDQVLGLFGICPAYDLSVMKPGQDLYDVTARVLVGMREVLSKECPDVVLVHGDTTTSMAAALAAFYRQIPVGHVEAGLRTYHRYDPWPEEMNRLLTGRLATYHFSPTAASRENLLKEGVSEEAVLVTGNTVIDALHQVVDKIGNEEGLAAEIEATLCQAGYPVSRLKGTVSEEPVSSSRGLSRRRRLILVTGHRRENFGEGFRQVCRAIRRLAEVYPDVDFVYPMHLNPNVRQPIRETFGDRHWPNLFFIEPLEYLAFVYLMEKSYLVLTDSGGIQEEAPGLGKPVLVMRQTTERPEAVEAGTVRLVGTDEQRIVEETSRLLEDADFYSRMSHRANPYGDGRASARIREWFAERYAL